jgi:hypothetical protein
MNLEPLAKLTNQLLIFVTCLCGLYIGIGGLGHEDLTDKITTLNGQKAEISDTVAVRVRGLVYPNIYELKKANVAEQYTRFMRFYPWMKNLPDIIILLLTCCSFSLIGSYILVARNFNAKRISANLSDHPSMIMSGFLTGLVVMGLSFLLPKVLISEGGKIQPYTLMFLSLFGGIYSNALFKKLSKYVDEMFKTN